MKRLDRGGSFNVKLVGAVGIKQMAPIRVVRGGLTSLTVELHVLKSSMAGCVRKGSAQVILDDSNDMDAADTINHVQISRTCRKKKRVE